jgi:hypothetical protein
MKSSILLLLSASLGFGATWIPIQPSNSGFYNADIIYENSRASVGTGTVPIAGTAIGSRYFYETGLDGVTGGLSSSRAYTFTGAGAGNGAAFQLQPYTANNVSHTGITGSATATFTGGNYDTIAIAATAGGATGAGTTTNWTVTYTSGATLVVPLTISDWGATATNELFNVGRTDVVNSTTAAAQQPLNSPMWSAYVYTLDTDPTLTIQSISYTVLAGTGTVDVFGFSGQVIPEASCSALLAAALGGSLLVRRRK